MYVSGCYTFYFFYFEITKHLEGIFIVFATEVACLFKLFYSELHIYFAYIYLSIRFLKKEKLIRHWSFLCKREQKECKKFINKRKYSNEKPRENLWKLSRRKYFFYGKIFAVLYTRKSNDTTEDFMREMFLEFLFLYCACEIWC